MNTDLHGLYAITDSTLLPDTDTLLRAVDAALRGGARVVQYRDKSSDAARRLEQAQALVTLCQRYGKPLLINDDIELAANAGAQGVHLGQKDGAVPEARARLGEQAIIGVTCHDCLALALKAETEGADYVAFGAFFASATKPDAKPAPLELLQQARNQLQVPVVAIGGISSDNARFVIDNGAQMIAVVGALFGADDTEQRARAFAELFGDASA